MKSGASPARFRDEHATLFGSDVVVLPISVDSVATHASWAKEMGFPFALVADPDLAAEGAHRVALVVPGRDGEGAQQRRLRTLAQLEREYVGAVENPGAEQLDRALALPLPETPRGR